VRGQEDGAALNGIAAGLALPSPQRRCRRSRLRPALSATVVSTRRARTLHPANNGVAPGHDDAAGSMEGSRVPAATLGLGQDAPAEPRHSSAASTTAREWRLATPWSLACHRRHRRAGNRGSESRRCRRDRPRRAPSPPAQAGRAGAARRSEHHGGIGAAANAYLKRKVMRLWSGS